MYLSIIIAILFIAIACSKSVREHFMQMMIDLKADDETKELIYALILVSLFLFIITLSKRMKSTSRKNRKMREMMSEDSDDSDDDDDDDDDDKKGKKCKKGETREDFFFVAPEDRALPRNLKTDQEISFPARQAGFTSDRGINFSFTTVGSGQCDQGGCQAYGIIKGCPGQKVYGNNQYGDKVL